MPLTYKLTYAVSRQDSNAKEVAKECTVHPYKATAEGPFYKEGRYYVTYEILADSNEKAIEQTNDLIDVSPMDIDMFTLKDANGVEFYNEDGDVEPE